MLPASTIIDRCGLDPNRFDATGVSFREMPRWMSAALADRATGLTIGRTVFIQPAVWSAVIGGHKAELTAHELRHVEQWNADGWRFLVRYLTEYVRFRLVGADHDASYHAISYEMDARNHAARVCDVAR